MTKKVSTFPSNPRTVLVYFIFIKNELKIQERRPEMTIEIAKDWFDNNISGQEGFTLDSENEVYRKTISEADLTFEFSTDTDGEF